MYRLMVAGGKHGLVQVDGWMNKESLMSYHSWSCLTIQLIMSTAGCRLDHEFFFSLSIVVKSNHIHLLHVAVCT